MDSNRFRELYARAYEKNYITHTDFLNLEEQSELVGEHLECTLFGGYENAERVMAFFGEGFDENDTPIGIIRISPSAKKFADALTHRDFLGALMNLGIKRELLGDIVIKDNCGYLFLDKQLAQYICDNLTRIKHTTVKCELCAALPEGAVSDPEESSVFASSQRADVLVCAVYRFSRKQGAELFVQGKVFVNSALCKNPSRLIKEGELVSVRGYGRFRLCSQLRKTKKNRAVLGVKIY